MHCAVGGFVIAGGIGSLIHLKFSSIIIGIYELLAGAVILALEVVSPTEQQKALVHSYASFLHSFVGRGVFYILLGVLMLDNYLLVQICGGAVALVGIIYVALHFVHLFEAPSTMQAPSSDPEAQPVWQAPTE
ncbi:hypothetical protein Q8F55_001986 [Vanrija albida]|uniref:Golgi apparatus membrane protein TVP15 n=1 Tax=Vanrija albida TaxID=181172 RepID=A0ABR3Q8I0_9TREE